VSALPIALSPALATRFEAAFDRDAKIVHGLDQLGPVAGRDVLLIDAEGSSIGVGLLALGARLVHQPLTEPFRLAPADASIDIVVGLWSAFREVSAAALAEVDRVLRPEGRLLVVHDYGRDDVRQVLGTRPELDAWSRKSGPFLSNGFRVRVLHCWWDFDSLDVASTFLSEAFGERGKTFGATLKRPRLAHKIAIYHRSRPAA
jgi:SAM-dependent methyltransferase